MNRSSLPTITSSLRTLSRQGFRARPRVGQLERRIIDPEVLDAGAKQTLIDELYATHEQIFAGVSKSSFAAYVVNSPAERTRIEVYRVDGRVVGYQAVHTFVRTIEGERWVVIRAEQGKLPAYRRDANARLLIAEVLRACVCYPRARKAFLGCLVHPSAYIALARVAPQVFPSPAAPTPAPIARAMAELARSFELEQVAESGDHDCREVGWITLETRADRRSWAARRDELTHFYMSANPGYINGEGLLTLVPISLSGLVQGSFTHALRSSSRKLARARVQLDQVRERSASARLA